MRGGRKWLLAVAGALGLVCLGGNVVMALSPANISPGYPTSLDDAASGRLTIFAMAPQKIWN